MNEIGEMELKFAELIWPRAPIGSGELVALCENEFGWKKSTTYTMLKRLEKRGLFENADSVVRVKMTREEFDAGRSERFVKENFGGSLPGFLAAFTKKVKLSDKDIAELEELIRSNRRE